MGTIFRRELSTNDHGPNIVLLTVAIPTHNRAPLLRRTLAGLCEHAAKARVEWELLVVANNCSDNTDEVAAEFKDQLPLRVIAEPTPGVSAARNRSTREARGEWIFWIDDDVKVGPRWFEGASSLDELDSSISFVGGPILPEFEVAPSSADSACLAVAPEIFGGYDLGARDRLLDDSTLPNAGNMAVRRSVAAQFPFDPALGMIGGRRIAGEENILFQSLLSRGHTGKYLADCKVFHWIPRERMGQRHINQWARSAGRSMAEIDRRNGTPVPRAWHLRQAAVSLLRSWRAGSANPVERARQLISMSRHLGEAGF